MSAVRVIFPLQWMTSQMHQVSSNSYANARIQPTITEEIAASAAALRLPVGRRRVAPPLGTNDGGTSTLCSLVDLLDMGRSCYETCGQQCYYLQIKCGSNRRGNVPLTRWL